MTTIEKVQTPRKPPPWVNRVMTGMLRSPLSGLVDKGILLLTVFGRRTGRPYTFPVQYLWDGDELWVMSGAGAEKTWWRNLVGGAPVEVLLQGRVRRGRGTAVTFEQDPATVQRELQRYVERFPTMARKLGIHADDPESLQRAAAATVMVHIDLGAAIRPPRG